MAEPAFDQERLEVYWLSMEFEAFSNQITKSPGVMNRPAGINQLPEVSADRNEYEYEYRDAEYEYEALAETVLADGAQTTGQDMPQMCEGESDPGFRRDPP